MKKILDKVIVGLLMASMVTFFFTLSMLVSSHTATTTSNILLAVSAPVMVACIVLVNIRG